MIYTITPSPSLDLIMTVPTKIIHGETYRAQSEEIRPGGKGINISIVLRNLGVTSTALGFVAGFSGDELMRLASASGINTGFIRVRRGRTRINLRLKESSNTLSDTKIHGLGPTVTENDITYLLNKVKSLQDGDFLVLAGIVPPSLPQNIYTKFFEVINDKNVNVIVDVTADYLKSIVKYRPFLVKPNLAELSEYVDFTVNDKDSILKAATKILNDGAQNVLVSLGHMGALFLSHDFHLFIDSLGGDAIDSTGAGDSMIAGFLSEFLNSHDLKLSAYKAVATGCATATSYGTATSDYINSLYNEYISNI